MNAAVYHLAEAERLQKAGKKNSCRQSAWDVVAYAESAKQVKEDGTSRNEWIPSARYELRDGRILSETELFVALEDASAQGKKLFQACGGSGDPPMRPDDRYLAQAALKMQAERGPDGVVRTKMW